MANNAIQSRKATIKVKIGAGAYTKVNGVTGFSGLRGGSPSVIPVTDLDSDAVEKQLGLIDEGQFTIEANYLDTDAGQILLNTARDDNSTVTFEVSYKGVAKAFVFDAFVMTAELSAEVDSKVPVTFNTEITGKVSRATPSSPVA